MGALPYLLKQVPCDVYTAPLAVKEVQKMIDDGTLTGPLAGVPVAIKDNMCTKGMLTTCSSKILYNFIPTYTAAKEELFFSQLRMRIQEHLV